MKSAAVHLCVLIALACLTLAPAIRGQSAPTFTTLHVFTGVGTDGLGPLDELIQGRDGNFYGTAATGGSDNVGIVFVITPAGALTTLHSFNSADGALPYAGLLQDGDGTFYGEAAAGGSGGYGTVFSMTPAGVLTTLHDFTRTGTDGGTPYSSLVGGNDGYFYGVTAHGGGSTDDGTVFSITPAGTFATLYSFSGADGANPVSGPVLGGDGLLYGTTNAGGSSGDGTVYSITPGGMLTTVHSFTDTGTDGKTPQGRLLAGGDGKFYGTTSDGGSSGAGTVYSITPDGVLTTLYNFTGTATDGAGPQAALVRGPDGNFYGTTAYGGSSGVGTIFSITPAGVVTILHNFSGSTADGEAPHAALTLGSDGNFYGMTYGNQTGTVFSVSLAPTVTSATSATGVTGQFFAYQIAGTNFPTTFAASGLPAGLSLDPTKGLITGTPTAAGTTQVGLSVTNAFHTGTATLILTVVSVPATPTPTPTPTPVPGSPTPTPTPGQPTPTPTPGQPTPTPTPGPTPTANLVFPPANFTVPIQVPLTLVASLDDPGGTAVNVLFFANATLVGTIPVAPGASYSVSYTPPSTGFFEISAVVTDTSGYANTTASVGITVITPPNGETAGGIEFEGGLDQHAFAASSTINLAAQLTAPSTAGFQSVTFYADNTPVATFDGSGALMNAVHAPGRGPVRQDAAVNGTVFSAPYTLPGSDNLVNLIATALTKDGLSVSSRPVALRVEANARPPTISLIDPTANGVSLYAGHDVHINAQAADPAGSITRAEYYAGNTEVADVQTPPVFGFDFTPPSAGVYVLSAIVTDSAGLSAGSAPLTLTVQAAAPPTVNLSVSGAAVEGGANGIILVSRTGDTSAPLTVLYKAKGTPVAGLDYKKLPGAVIIPAGASKAKLKVKPLAGLTGQGTLKLKLQLVAPTDGSYQVGPTGTVKLKLVGQ